MNRATIPEPDVKPLLTPERMARILSARHSTTSAAAYQQVATHLGRPVSPGRRKSSVSGRAAWVCC